MVSPSPPPPLESSDSQRTARPLKFLKTVTFDVPLRTELGGVLPKVTVAYETYGTLNATRDNAILICHALSGDSHVASHDADDDAGWWEIVVGPGKTIDTNTWFLVCPNVLGGCRGTTGPSSTNPETGRPYGADFPIITARDIVELQRRLMEHLGLSMWLAVIGGSMGGHQVLTWATQHPERVRGAIALATSPRLNAQALAFDVVGRNAILRDPNFAGGQYYDQSTGPDVGLALARMLAHVTYLSSESMDLKFGADRLLPRDVPTEFEKRFSVGSYLAYQGHKFVERFDANSYVTLSLAMDMFDLGRNQAELEESLRPARCRWLLLSFTSDWLFPPDQSKDILRALTGLAQPVSYCNVQSKGGHDAFLLADELSTYGGLIHAFLENLTGAPELTHDLDEPATSTHAGVFAAIDPDSIEDGRSIFHQHRIDHDQIVELVPRAHRVLDLGCATGSLLSKLKSAGRAGGMGIEIDERAVVTSVRRGHDVIHADIGEALALFRDGQFDTVVLSQTLQTIRDVEHTIREMLRVGRQCLVSFPNLAYAPLRHMLAHVGRAPKSSGLLSKEWYDTANIRFFTLLDFEDFCRARGIAIHRRIALDTETRREIGPSEDANLLADMAIFVIQRSDCR